MKIFKDKNGNIINIGEWDLMPKLQDVLDENGNPKFEETIKQHIDENGNPIFDENEQPILITIKKPIYETIFTNHFLISSFHFNELEKVRKYNQNISIGVLAEQFSDDLLAFAQEIYAFSIHLSYKILNENILQHIQNKGFKVFVYTVNEVNNIEKFKKMGVDGIFCNFPERMNHV
jgi:glycerophosphoryl diester phosphodiesterase